jgi:hypothetical protein
MLFGQFLVAKPCTCCFEQPGFNDPSGLFGFQQPGGKTLQCSFMLLYSSLSSH